MYKRQIVDIVNITDKDRKLLFDSNLLSVDSNNKLQWNDHSSTGNFNKMKQMTEKDNLFLFDAKIIIRCV